MNVPNREPLISCFNKVPHKGLDLIFPHLRAFGVMLDTAEWDLHVDGDFPHAYYDASAHHRLAVGVSRKPMVGYQSWCALTDGPFGERRPPTIRLMIDEDGRHSLELDPGLTTWSDEMRDFCRQFFSPTVFAVPFDAERTPALLERFCELVHRRT